MDNYQKILNLYLPVDLVNIKTFSLGLFLSCYERLYSYGISLSGNNKADVIDVFNSTSRYLDDMINIDNPSFKQTVGQIYPTEL